MEKKEGTGVGVIHVHVHVCIGIHTSLLCCNDHIQHAVCAHFVIGLVKKP